MNETKTFGDYSEDEVRSWKGHEITRAFLALAREWRTASNKQLVAAAASGKPEVNMYVHGGQIEAFDHLIRFLEV